MRIYRCACSGVVMALAFAACSTAPPPNGTTYDLINKELKEATENRAVVQQKQDVMQSLLPPLALDIPQAPPIATSRRFDLSVVNVPAPQVLSAIVADTPYSMVVHP